MAKHQIDNQGDAKGNPTDTFGGPSANPVKSHRLVEAEVVGDVTPEVTPVVTPEEPGARA